MLTLSDSDTLLLSKIGFTPREDVEKWLRLLGPIVDEVKVMGSPITVAIKRHAMKAGIAWQTVYKKLTRFERYGVRGLINQQTTPLDRNLGLPQAFRVYWQGLMLSHQRDTTGKQAHRQLVTLWKAWRAGDDTKAIPGYDTCPEAETYTQLPHGWSLQNLMKHAPTKFARKLARKGPAAVKDFLPLIRTTRVGLDFMELIEFDDQWHDVYINMLGVNRAATRPLSFNALDVFTACDFARGYKPIIVDDATGKRSMLKEQDFFWFVLHILTEYGWRMDDKGSTFIVEHGTANMNATLKASIQMATQGRVNFSSGGIYGAPLMAGLQFGGQARGNFKFKGHRESWFNLFRNYSAALPAPTGLSPEAAPEESYGLLRYNDKMLKLREHLSPERQALLKLPILPWEKYTQLADQIAEIINLREDHELEGWEKLGFTINEARLPGVADQWFSLTQLADMGGEMEAMARGLMKQPGYSRLRKLSPREVFNSMRQQAPLRRLSPQLWHMVIPAEYAIATQVTSQHTLRVKRDEFGPETLEWWCPPMNSAGRQVILHAGEKVLLYVNPYALTTALVCDLKGAPIGTVNMPGKPARNDLDGWAELHGKRKTLEAALSRPVKHHLTSLAEERTAMIAHNQAVIDGSPVTPAEISSAKKTERAARQLARVEGAEVVAVPQVEALGTEEEERVTV